MHDTLDLFVELQPLWDWWKSPGWAYYAVRKVREILQSNLLDRNICTWIYAGNSAKPGSFFSSPIIHLIQSKASVTFRGKKVLLLYFQHSCTVQSNSYSQSPRLNPLSGKGVCLRMVLTAGTRLSVLAIPFKVVTGRSSLRITLKKKPLSQAYTAPHLKI